MTPEEMASELQRLGWRLQPPIDQKTCKHVNQRGSGSIGSDGSSKMDWYCLDCGLSSHSEVPGDPNYRMQQFYN